MLFDRKTPADRIALDKATSRTVDAQGFLHIQNCNISKANVCPYLGSEIPNAEELKLDPSKVYQLYRDPEELAKAAPTFNNLPLMDYHYEVDAEGLEEDEKLHGKIVGSVGTDCHFAAPYLVATLVVYTAGAIEGIESDQQRELSCAYRYDLDMTPGTTPDGVTYDGRMKNIVGNHVALVDEGRAGKDVVIKDRAMKPSLAKLMADGVRAAYGKDESPVITEVVKKLTEAKVEVTEKLKPNASEEIGKALDDCTSAIDLAIHHLMDVEEEEDVAKDSITTEVEDDNPEGINQYTGGGGNSALKSVPGKASHAAQSASNKASEKASPTREHAAQTAHQRASEVHRNEATRATSRGQFAKAGTHASEADKHEAKSKEHAANYSRLLGGKTQDSITAEVETASPKASVTADVEIDFADEKNKKYPIDTAAHVQAAASYFGQAKNRNKYSKEERTKIDARITSAKKKFKIGANAESK